MSETSEVRSISNKIEVVANVSIIAAAIVFLLSMGWFFLRNDAAVPRPRSAIEKGTKLTLPNVDWSASPQTLLLVLSTKCKYCTVSAPFYRRLVDHAAVTRNTRLMAVFPQPVDESRAYLATNNVGIETLQQLQPASLGVKGTPTLILVDSNGAVIESWDGMIPPDAESQVLASVK